MVAGAIRAHGEVVAGAIKAQGEVVAGAIKAQGGVVAGAIQAQGVAVAAAIKDAAQPNLAEIWGLVFAAIVAVAVAAKAVIAMGKFCWPRGGEETRGRAFNKARKDVEMGLEYDGRKGLKRQ